MIDYSLLAAVVAGITVLLILILYLRIQAFIALLIASIVVGVIAGLAPIQIINTMIEGMGSTLGFVALVVGLGSIFGAILEHSGGAESLANYLLLKFGEKRAPSALSITGFIIAIPVFFDVAFIIMVPIIYALQRKTGKSLLLYSIPLLAGLAVTHTFIPPTPGPVAVADILGADLGWVILFGFLAGLPAVIVGGILFGKYIAMKINVEAPGLTDSDISPTSFPPVGLVLAIIGIPILLIVSNTIISSPWVNNQFVTTGTKAWLQMIGHPVSALIIANLIAWYMLGIKRGYHKEKLLEISSSSMKPAGIIILLTGAGGVFKQMLVDTGSGEMLAVYFADKGYSIMVIAFVTAVLVRVLQGSSTVSMITAAGLTAPLIGTVTAIDKALLVITIASGSLIFSHVNDSGFWLVSKYLGISEKQTFKSWTVMTTLLALVGFACAGLFALLLD